MKQRRYDYSHFKNVSLDILVTFSKGANTTNNDPSITDSSSDLDSSDCNLYAYEVAQFEQIADTHNYFKDLCIQKMSDVKKR